MTEDVKALEKGEAGSGGGRRPANARVENVVATPQEEVAPGAATIIEPKKGWVGIDFKEFWRYRELLYFLTKAM